MNFLAFFLYEVSKMKHDASPVFVGCVVMASGRSQRFGSNKLLASFRRQPMVCSALALADSPVFCARLAVTRSPEVAQLCRKTGIPALLHDQPLRSDTVALGLSALLEQQPALAGCVFLPGDQPLLKAQTLQRLVQAFCSAGPAREQQIFRLGWMPQSGPRQAGSPVLFGRAYFGPLLHLPPGQGGSAVLRQHPEQVRFISPDSPLELQDADTPEALRELENAL